MTGHEEAPRGALDKALWRDRLKQEFPDKTIFHVGTRLLRKKKARQWFFSSGPPIYYFDNFWDAYAYALKRKVKIDFEDMS